MTEVVLVALGLLIVTMPIWARQVSERVKARRVRLTGRLGLVEDWLPVAADKAARAFMTSQSWTADTFDLVDRAGQPTGTAATVSSGPYTIRVAVPLYDPQTRFTKNVSLVAVVTMDRYQYRSAIAYRLFMGKYPDTTAIMASNRLVAQVKKQGRKAARRNAALSES